MEQLMIKAIRQFKKERKNCEIRTCSVWESSGSNGNITYALFHIEYVDCEQWGEYKHTNIGVYK